jgi:signal transduction histidine kinase
VRICIDDNGIGIDPQYHDKIFNVFERLHRTDEYPGTGIGLAIVKKGIERLGGRVGLNSTAGKGSCFWIELEKATAAVGKVVDGITNKIFCAAS